MLPRPEPGVNGLNAKSLNQSGNGNASTTLDNRVESIIVRYMSNKSHREAVRLARLFRALSSPSRLELIGRLVRGCSEGTRCCTAENLTLCIDSLAGQLDLVKSTVSHHVKELHEAGLITRTKRGRHNDFSVNRDLLRLAGAFLERLAGCCGAAATSGCGLDGGKDEHDREE